MVKYIIFNIIYMRTRKNKKGGATKITVNIKIIIQ